MNCVVVMGFWQVKQMFAEDPAAGVPTEVLASVISRDEGVATGVPVAIGDKADKSTTYTPKCYKRTP